MIKLYKENKLYRQHVCRIKTPFKLGTSYQLIILCKLASCSCFKTILMHVPNCLGVYWIMQVSTYGYIYILQPMNTCNTNQPI